MGSYGVCRGDAMKVSDLCGTHDRTKALGPIDLSGLEGGLLDKEIAARFAELRKLSGCTPDCGCEVCDRT